METVQNIYPSQCFFSAPLFAETDFERLYGGEPFSLLYFSVDKKKQVLHVSSLEPLRLFVDDLFEIPLTHKLRMSVSILHVYQSTFFLAAYKNLLIK